MCQDAKKLTLSDFKTTPTAANEDEDWDADLGVSEDRYSHFYLPN